jgi:hypothetical protein
MYASRNLTIWFVESSLKAHVISLWQEKLDQFKKRMSSSYDPPVNI